MDGKKITEITRLTVADMNGRHGHLEDPEPVEPLCSHGFEKMVDVIHHYVFADYPWNWKPDQFHWTVG